MKTNQNLDIKLQRLADALMSNGMTAGADTVKQAIGAVIELKALVHVTELTEAAICDLFEDLKAYGDQSRREQVTAICDRAKTQIAESKKALL